MSVPVLSSLYIAQESFEKHSCPSSVTRRESSRHREASSSFRAAQILRQGPLDPILRANPTYFTHS